MKSISRNDASAFCQKRKTIISSINSTKLQILRLPRGLTMYLYEFVETSGTVVLLIFSILKCGKTANLQM
jgi:hypothetical protein